ncbi:unnamed protein product [Paramecium sonneborni]|uniref:Uncharacterized protein n=1 Tax=Paramecium sonneborni TaxID=65129 RepID=A0A8S1P6I4_9CILI|nr:unnamed protein product [Paramecium sonneborni]
MDNQDQSIIVDEEFCDKNLFSHYQKSKRNNVIQNPQINLYDYQLNTVNRYHIGYIDHPHIKSSKIIISNKYEHKTFQSIKINQRSTTCRSQSVQNSKNLKSLSIEMRQFQIQNPKTCFFRSIQAQENLSQSYKKKYQQIQSLRHKDQLLKKILKPLLLEYVTLITLNKSQPLFVIMIFNQVNTQKNLNCQNKKLQLQ